MTAPPLVQTLPFVAWTLLATLAFGSFAFLVATRQRSDVTPGYVRFTAITAALLALFAALVEPGTREATGPSLAVHPSTTTADWSQLLTVTFLVLAVVYAIRSRSSREALVLGTTGILAALAVLGYAAVDWAPTLNDAVPLLVQLAVLSLVTGGSMAAIVLGHWYLVTPRISERPLIIQAQMLLGILVLQALLFVTWTTLGGGPGQDPFESLSSGPVLLVVLRLVVTIAFPIVLTWMAWRTAMTRSMESATGLLYINFAAVMAGTIGATALYVSSGILV